MNMAMFDPILIEMLADIYFATTKQDEEVPTVPGLALALCFNRTKDIERVLTDFDNNPSQVPEASVNTLMRSLTKIEEYYIRNGLSSKFPATLVKFCLGAYHDRKDTPPPVQQGAGGVTNIQIVFEAPKNQFQLQKPEDQQQLTPQTKPQLTAP